MAKREGCLEALGFEESVFGVEAQSAFGEFQVGVEVDAADLVLDDVLVGGRKGAGDHERLLEFVFEDESV